MQISSLAKKILVQITSLANGDSCKSLIGKWRQMQMTSSAKEDSCNSLHRQIKTDANQFIGK